MFILKLDDKGTRIFEDKFIDKYQKIQWDSDTLWKEEIDLLFNERYTVEAMKVSMATYYKLIDTHQASINNPNYVYQSKPTNISNPSTPNPMKTNTKSKWTANTPHPNKPNPMKTNTKWTANTPYSLSSDMVRVNDTEITRQQLYALLETTKPASCATCNGYSPMGMYLIPSTDGPLCDWVCLYFCKDECKNIYCLTGGVS